MPNAPEVSLAVAIDIIALNGFIVQTGKHWRLIRKAGMNRKMFGILPAFFIDSAPPHRLEVKRLNNKAFSRTSHRNIKVF